MNHFAFIVLLFLFVFLPLFTMALCLAAKRFPGDDAALNHGETICIPHPTNGSKEVAGKNFAAIRRSILLKILTSPLLPTRITPKPVGPQLTGLLFCSGQLKKI